MIELSELRERLLDAKLCTMESLRGCSTTDWKRVEKAAGRSLPEEYKDIMSVLGRGAGDFMSDVKMFYPDILTLTNKSREYVADELEFPDDAFVVANRYGEQILFLRLDDMPNTPVYKWFDEKPTEYEKVFDSIWAFIEEELEAHEWQARD